MRDPEVKRHWIDICAEAGICEDPKRFAELASEIAEILEREQKQLQENHTAA